jgi:hypothetical protein
MNTKKILLSLSLILACNSAFVGFSDQAFAEPYTLDKKGAKFKQLTPAEQAKFDIFQNAIANNGLSPRQAADEMGGADYKKLQGNQYQIRLSEGNRATFLIQDKKVKIL